MKTLLACLTLGAVLAALWLLQPAKATAALGSPGAVAGRACTVQFRRDALGTAAALPVPPMTGSYNGAETAISGSFRRENTEWLILDQGGREIWVAKSVILLISFQQ